MGKKVSFFRMFSLAISLAFWLGSALAALAAQGNPIPGSGIPQFVDPLPKLTVQGGPMDTIIAGAGEIELHMREFKACVMPSTFAPAGGGAYDGTWVWGYISGPYAPAGTQGTYIGPVIVATRGVPTQVRFVNDLGSTDTTSLLFMKDSIDQTLHWADPLGRQANMCNHDEVPGQPPAGDCAQPYSGPFAAVPHLHGGEVPPVLDGGPNSWFTSDGNYLGNAYYTKGFKGEVGKLPSLPKACYPAGAIVFHKPDKTRYIVASNGKRWEKFTANYAVYRYPNVQEAAPIWFHDHLLGATRLNVYAGLAGAYLITDPLNPPPAGLPGPAEIIPLIIQDRMFDEDGQLFFPNVGINPEHPFWLPEFLGDAIVVNGKVWPYLSVQPKRYRFLIINGSNARTYELFLADQNTGALGPAIWQVGTDGGYLDGPVRIDPNAAGGLQKLAVMPGERADIIIDFAGLCGKTLVLRNTANAPFPDGDPVDPATTGKILQVRVNQPFTDTDASYDPASGGSLRPGHEIVRLPGTPQGPAVIRARGAIQNVQAVRQLTLNEVMRDPTVVDGVDFPGGPTEVLLNNTGWDGKKPDHTARRDFKPVTIGGLTEYYSELPKEGTTEIWEVANMTADSHPIHTHLTQFQLVDRQAFDVDGYFSAYSAAFPGGTFKGVTYPKGAYIPEFGPPLGYKCGNKRALGGNPDIAPFLLDGPVPPKANEEAWKDTIEMPPGMVTRIAVRYAPQDKALSASDLYFPFNPAAFGFGFVWHCHIIDHEDNEMMRPLKVISKSVARSYRTFRDF